jgi:hypothetical protein
MRRAHGWARARAGLPWDVGRTLRVGRKWQVGVPARGAGGTRARRARVVGAEAGGAEAGVACGGRVRVEAGRALRPGGGAGAGWGRVLRGE